MSSKFISAIVATALVITTVGAQPSLAGERRTQDNRETQIIMGIAALAALGILLKDRDADKARPRDRAHEHYEPRPRNTARHHTITPRPLPDRVRQSILPKECMRRVETRYGTQRVLAKPCLRRNDVRVKALPERCHTRFYRGDRKRMGYRVGCLKKHGYRIGRH